jgi:hypothetical protein
MRYMGFDDATVTPVGTDEGIDIVATDAVAQVKMEALPVGRPIVQSLHGAATVEAKRGLFFSLSGYTPEAVSWATRAGVALFAFDLQGEPVAANERAAALLPR